MKANAEVAIGKKKNNGNAEGRNPNSAKRNRTRREAGNRDAVRDGHGHAVGFGRTESASCTASLTFGVVLHAMKTKMPWSINPNGMPRSLMPNGGRQAPPRFD